jgi:pyrroline-5-carboxylate reductase
MNPPIRLGILGTGALGGDMARAMRRSGQWPPETLVLCNRSGRIAGFDDWPKLRVETAPEALAGMAEILLLAIPPAELPRLALHAPDRPILSVIAGATVAQLAARTGSPRILRAMSSPAAETGLAFSPVFAAPGATPDDLALAERLLAACGAVAVVSDEAQIDTFTALTGPVPGFVAFFAHAMADHAVRSGIAPEIADRAVRQLFLAAGAVMAEGATTPAAHVQAMLDYAGTTAAGLAVLEASDVAEVVHRALDAAAERARTIAAPPD